MMVLAASRSPPSFVPHAISAIQQNGERDGCARCKTLQITCLYAESRVGKVQGPRLRHRSLAAQVTPKDPVLVAPPVPSPGMTEAHDAPDSPSTHAFNHTEQHTWTGNWEPTEDWTGVQMLSETFTGLDNLLNEENLVLPANAPAGDGEQAGNEPEHANNDAGTIHCSLSAVMDASSSPSEGSSEPPAALQLNHSGGIASSYSSTGLTQGLGFDLPALQALHTATPTTSYITQKPQYEGVAQLGTGEKEFARLNSRCALSCTHIIATLETYLLLELKALDLILEATRKAANEIEKLVHLQRELRCGRCTILFTVALSQITELLDAGRKQLSDSGGGWQGDFAPGLQMPFMPSLGFGAFSFVAEEQLSLRLSLIGRECRHVGKIVANVEALAATDTTGQKITSLAGLKQRLEEMCDASKKA
ncbi:hypothetical protein ANO14919_040660 [Xylariales sp. No.14919]|nr:hypothetical protein ANO14919_040660 [Xylariales sp. No.14919]